ncbi:unnamed protein product [Boreogadus saida]
MRQRQKKGALTDRVIKIHRLKVRQRAGTQGGTDRLKAQGETQTQRETSKRDRERRREGDIARQTAWQTASQRDRQKERQTKESDSQPDRQSQTVRQPARQTLFAESKRREPPGSRPESVSSCLPAWFPMLSVQQLLRSRSGEEINPRIPWRQVVCVAGEGGGGRGGGLAAVYGTCRLSRGAM